MSAENDRYENGLMYREIYTKIFREYIDLAGISARRAHKIVTQFEHPGANTHKTRVRDKKTRQ